VAAPYTSRVQVGRVLAERYEIRRLIAEGSTGAVWAAHDRTSDTEIAVKTVSLDQHGWRAEVRDRCLQEARLLEVSPHPNLVAIHDVGETEDGYLFLVLELLRGETLAERLAHPPAFTGREVLTIGLGIARGLAALHERDIVHRDIKPANVVLHQPLASEPSLHTSIAVPKIIDLGISKMRAAAADPELFATLTATGQVLGTPQYMSYEQAVGAPDVDARSDICSLGVVLYEMLAGRTPFAAPNVNAALAAIRNTSPAAITSIAPDAPSVLHSVIDRCLERDPAKRYASAAELVQELEAPLVPMQAPAKTSLIPLRAARLPLRAWLAAAAVALCLAGLLLAKLASDPSVPDRANSSDGVRTPPSEGAASEPLPQSASVAVSAPAAPSRSVTSSAKTGDRGSNTGTPPPPPSRAAKPGSVTRVDDPGF